MRSFDDIKIVNFTGTGSVTIDLERAEADPQYLRICGQHDKTVPAQRDEALKRYVAVYFGRELMFQEMPCTNGPGEIFPVTLEVRNAQYGSDPKAS
jgi:hypothetical protein